MALLHRIEDNEFDLLVLDAKRPVVVKFTAKWCKPCEALTPIILKMRDFYPHINFYEVDIGKNRHLADDYNVKSLPTIIFFLNGKVDGRVTGLIKAKILKAVLSKYD